jgi:hypothetical protein
MGKVVYGETNKGATRTAPKKPDESIGSAATPAEGLFTEIKNSVKDSIAFTGNWSSNQEKYHKMRMRIKKTKTFPFADSSNLRMPTAEMNIRKIKAAVMGIIFGARPIVQALPSPGGNMDTAMKIEKLIDHLAMNVMEIEGKAEIGIDQSLEKGMFLLKPHWRRDIIERTEEVDLNELPTEEALFLFNAEREQILAQVIQRLDVDLHDSVAEQNISAVNDAIDKILSGQSKVTFELQDMIYNFPDVALASPERVYVPVDSGYHPQSVGSITHEFFLSLDTIKRNAKFKGWSQESVDTINASKSIKLESLTDTQKDLREGIEKLMNPSKLVRVWETYGYYDIDGSGKKKKAIITSFPDFSSVARKVLLNNYSGRYPFVKLFYELNDDRWFSHRGICELLEDIIKEIDVQHNMKIDSQTIRNAPMFLYRAGMVNPNLVQMIPNQAIPVNGLQSLEDTVKVLNMHNPNVEFSYEREQQILETKVQEMVGQIDFSLQSQINRRQPRTLGEVEAQNQAAGRVFSLDAKHYINAFSELFNFIFELWSQHGDDEYEFLYFGESLQGERVKLTKEEIQGKYNIVVRGNDQNTNPNVKIQKAQQIIAAVTNPILLQTGIVGPQQIVNGLKRFYQAMDINNWEELINVQPQPQQPSAVDRIIPSFKDLTDQEKAQVLAQAGVQPDVQGRGAINNKEALMEAAEIASKVGG